MENLIFAFLEVDNLKIGSNIGSLNSVKRNSIKQVGQLTVKTKISIFKDKSLMMHVVYME